MQQGVHPDMDRIEKRLRAVLWLGFLAASAAVWWPAPAVAARIKEVASVQGVRSNPLVGYGLVVGLDGTGDQTTSAPFTTQSINSLLQQMGVTVPAGVSMQLKNVAAVMVTAQLPAFAQPGQVRGGRLGVVVLRAQVGERLRIVLGGKPGVVVDATVAVDFGDPRPDGGDGRHWRQGRSGPRGHWAMTAMSARWRQASLRIWWYLNHEHHLNSKTGWQKRCLAADRLRIVSLR